VGQLLFATAKFLFSVYIIFIRFLSLTISGFDLAWFNSISSKHLYVCSLHGAVFYMYILKILYSSCFSELSLVGLAVDLCLTNHCPSVLRHCWLGYLTCKVVPEMTYNVVSAMLNPTILLYSVC